MAKNLRDNGFSSSWGRNSGGSGLTGKLRGSLKRTPTGYVAGSLGGNLTRYGYPNSAEGFQGITSTSGLTGPNSGSTGGGRGRSSGKLGNNDAYNALLAAYKKNQYDDYLNQKKGAAQAAYDKGMGMLNDAYGAYMAALAENLDSTKGQLLDAYNRSKKSIQDDAAASLKQAYINKMLSAKNIDQQMSAQGLSGGATETTRASMANNYGNARNEINTTQNRNLSELEGNYNDNLAQALQAYNQAVASAQLQKAQQAIELENALANNEIAALDDYYSLMGDTTDNYAGSLDSLLLNMNDFTFDPTQATNTVNAPEVMQANTQDSRTYNNLLQALLQSMGQKNGNGALNTVLQNNYLKQILSQLGR